MNKPDQQTRLLRRNVRAQGNPILAKRPWQLGITLNMRHRRRKLKM